ncbi:MAG: M20/M25/M40 family metallo-hydrolase [Planctomycetia bacterium]|nr:M20/M25/M40 family metallo-hydrolase [Planctomycetia bacterium]
MPSTPRNARRPTPPGGTIAVALLTLACCGGVALAAERMSAAHATIKAADAGRHVGVLADDAFEGREGGSRGGRAAAAYIVEQLTKLGLEPAGDGGSYFQPFGGMRNILAILRGSDPHLAEELVVVGAHYDHVGYGNADNSYGPFGYVHNGADDNASGVAGLLEVAEAIQHLPERPRRSILFAFWDGEEKGLLGSYHFLRVKPAALAHLRVAFALNLDMIGHLRGERLEVYGTRTAPGLREAVLQANNRPGNAAGLELTFVWDIEDDSDHYPFIAAKIPTVMFHTGLHDHYHRPSDDVHLVNLEGIEPVARLTLGFVTAIADDPAALPTFRPESRTESNATRNRLEGSIPDTDGSPRGRWGLGTRHDPGEPSSPVVVRVWRNSPAARAGLSPGDRILTVDEMRITGQDDMLARLRSAGPQSRVDIERRGRIMRLEMQETVE